MPLTKHTQGKQSKQQQDISTLDLKITTEVLIRIN